MYGRYVSPTNGPHWPTKTVCVHGTAPSHTNSKPWPFVRTCHPCQQQPYIRLRCPCSSTGGRSPGLCYLRVTGRRQCTGVRTSSRTHMHVRPPRAFRR